MADTWEIDEPLRPRVRPEGLAPEQLRPELRPEGLGQGLEQVGEVGAKATLRDGLPLDRTALVGLFDGPQGGSALLRLADGHVVKVAAGEAVDGGRVTAIGRDGLRLQRGDVEYLLTLPS